MSEPQKILPFVPVFVKLLKGPVEYVDKSLWEKLLQHKSELSAFLLPLGLSLVLDEQDGYAYVKHITNDEEENAVSWIPRRALSYEESIMLVLLREMMAEFEVGAATTRELIRKRREIKEYAELFFKENVSRVKFLKEMDRLIDRTAENGFLDCIEQHEVADEQKFRIKKIIKARVGSEELDTFLEALTGYRRSLETGADITAGTSNPQFPIHNVVSDINEQIPDGVLTSPETPGDNPQDEPPLPFLGDDQLN
ncbi:hypothetical protein DCC81_14190 [Chitinophaga parva]|uniref:DUF4194 domain-containing protein n=1 Tax=Chitinophaga parva TaxID=2169414 RepID=A0A2T7BGM2_9BACT|nr:DUF4194 domain-containing protein [Chitinophaga parva]PUZ25436.1 hypothetical protein DCC81_14190 [Chitinophaga parva]